MLCQQATPEPDCQKIQSLTWGFPCSGVGWCNQVHKLGSNRAVPDVHLPRSVWWTYTYTHEGEEGG